MKFLNTTMEARLREFWPTDEPLRVLSKEWNCSDSYVSQLAKKIGLPSRQGRIKDIRWHTTSLKFEARVEARQYFEAEAAKRNLTPLMLERVLLGIIINDRMVDAVMDDQIRTAA